ncbi:type II secretion system protein [Pseudomonas syringae]|nr:type II secretion system protein [Pseudomonas syringae]MBD8576540.1 type II secretion system protein [Pseudomonas syringae]MBD8792088.1 type II secretion system protein [Pseudomonas syringae]MBD8803350.1 type II secretion system protein [Pseudomonas syringae]MBD8814541.1 type II secretion system protein [Pseudomonas syringae]
MSRSFEPGPRRQRGDILLESLIGIVLMSIIGLGMTYASSRAAVSQRDMKVQNLAVSQMRDLIARYGKALCSTQAGQARITLPMQTTAITLDATCTDAPSVTIGGVAISAPTSTLGKVVLTTRSSDSGLFGGVIRVGDET